MNICYILNGQVAEGMVDDMSEAEEKNDLQARDDIVTKVLEQQPDDEILYDLAELFKVFGDSTRIKILYSMFETELCVNDIAKLLNLSQSSVSHQLRILKSSKLVKFRREGKSVFYSLDDEHVRAILSMGMEHVEE
jgi:DNA-binding transcriptional ArsR family regulator